MRRLSAGLDRGGAAAVARAVRSRHKRRRCPARRSTVTATVEAVEASTRTITLKGPKGNYVDVVAPDSVTKFSEIKVGDKITATLLREHRAAREAPRREIRWIATTPAVTPGTGAEAGRDRGRRSGPSRPRSPRSTQGAVDHLLGPEQLDIQLTGRRHEGARDRQGGRQGGHHLDRRVAGLVRGSQEVEGRGDHANCHCHAGRRLGICGPRIASAQPPLRGDSLIFTVDSDAVAAAATAADAAPRARRRLRPANLPLPTT